MSHLPCEHYYDIYDFDTSIRNAERLRNIFENYKYETDVYDLKRTSGPIKKFRGFNNSRRIYSITTLDDLALFHNYNNFVCRGESTHPGTISNNKLNASRYYGSSIGKFSDYYCLLTLDYDGGIRQSSDLFADPIGNRRKLFNLIKSKLFL